ncbi:MAG: DUF309 domain-containing protein [Deltaproteobacteria bacterium]|nr:DUF309 domain-containing protein [Deltaproteobacteria bacterium]
MSKVIADEMREGIRLFNARDFFECHEVLEELWRSESGEPRAFYQGLIQLAVGFYHLVNGNYRGATSVLQRGMEMLRPYAPAYLGVEVASLLAAVEGCRVRLEALGEGRIAEFDAALIPRIRLPEAEPGGEIRHRGEL